jgi:hypothetical protein
MASVVQYPALRPYYLRKIGNRAAEICPELRLCNKNICKVTFTWEGVVQSVASARARVYVRVRVGDSACSTVQFGNYIILNLIGM